MVTGIVLLGVALLCSMLSWWRLKGCDAPRRTVLALYPLSIFTIIYIVCWGMHRVVHSNWDSARLTFPFALVGGYDLYSMPGEGPLLPSIYGPFFAIAYLPATIFRTPTTALIAGYIISLILTIAPIKLELACVLTKRHVLYLPAFAFPFFAVAFMHGSLVQGMTFIHAEAPALGFAAMAIWFLNQHHENGRVAALVGSAIFATMATLTKQTYLPLLLFLPIVTFVRAVRGTKIRATIVHLGINIAALAIILCLLALFIDLKAMWFNTVTVPSRHAWIGGFQYPAWQGTYVRPPVDEIKYFQADYPRRIRVLSDSFQALFERHAALIAVGLLVFFIARREGLLTRRSAALSWLAASLMLLPSSVAGPVKLGGAYNAQAPALYMWLAAIIVLTAEMFHHDEEHARRGNAVLFIMVPMVMAVIFYLPRNKEAFQRFELGELDKNAQEIVFDYEKRHPGVAYFPENPLPVLMASGTLYHFYNGVEERNIAGFPVSPAHYAAHLPQNARYIVWTFGEGTTSQYLPFTTPIQLDELPLFTVHEVQRP